MKGSADGTGSGATFYFPAGMVLFNGNVYICDSANSTIRQLNPATGVVTTIAGVAGEPGYFDNANNQSLPSYFYSPEGITTDGTSHLYVADSGNNVIRTLTLSGANWVASTLAGNQNGQPGNTDGTGSSASFNNPLGICYFGGNLYVADSGNSAIREVTTGGATSTLVSQASGAFLWPEGITYNGSYLYVVDSGNCTVMQVSVGGTVTTIAGQAGVKGDVDGAGNAANFNWPEGITSDLTGGNLYVADTLNSTIRQVVISSGSVVTIAGQGGVNGSANGAGNVATFNTPMRVLFSSGTWYVADTYNETIRQIR